MWDIPIFAAVAGMPLPPLPPMNGKDLGMQPTHCSFSGLKPGYIMIHLTLPPNKIQNTTHPYTNATPQKIADLAFCVSLAAAHTQVTVFLEITLS